MMALPRHSRRAVLRPLLAGAAAAALFSAPLALPAHADTATRGAIIGTLGGETVRWFVDPEETHFWFLGEGEALPSFAGYAYSLPDGVGEIGFSLDLSNGAEELVLLRIRAPGEYRVLWQADGESDLSLRATYSQLPQNMASVMGDLRVTLDTVDEAGELLERGGGPELVISFTAQMAQHGH
jgi:hypothetical protein